LKLVDAVLCEDTRVTGKLLARYEIRKSMVSCHEHTDDGKLAHIVERLKGGENLAFASDAGTPGLSDPGNKLVSLALAAGIPVVPIPGVSALATIVSVAGIDMREFVFLGFPPHKKGRETFFRKVAVMEYPAVYYESPHRVMKNLDLLETFAPEKQVIIGRELTKMFEEILRGTIGDMREYFTENPGKQKGEFVVIIH
jgi:16S rRNA (cytidine1402-2'-O)-methyltransferase